jgi:hypothetical protein
VQGFILGSVVGDALRLLEWGSDDNIWPILGLAAFLAAGYRTPIAAVMFVAESSGGTAVVPALVAAAVSQLVAGESSVSAGQRVERKGHLEERFSLPLVSALTTDVLTVPSDATISEFVWVHALGRRQRVVPVVDGPTYRGLCSVEAATAIHRDEWEAHPIESIMEADVPTARPSWTLRDAVAASSASSTSPRSSSSERSSMRPRGGERRSSWLGRDAGYSTDSTSSASSLIWLASAVVGRSNGSSSSRSMSDSMSSPSCERFSARASSYRR